ncbi:MAG: hypothetical protein KBA60_11035 [Flavobacteriales bacterium]|nr:hypothetical protein [Flavobacteriales bacterium]HQV74542.1 hypothetical protein [Flavobacteriales bacterium]HQW39882.1 hypothetical protein [Flavobacteriales bacterium]
MKTWLLPLVFMVHVGSSSGQDQYVLTERPKPMKQWRVTQLNFGTGVESDHFSTMSLAQITAFAKSSQDMQRDLHLFEEEVSTVTSGIALYASAGFAKTKPSTGEPGTIGEVQVGVAVHTPREAMVTYKNKGLDTSIVYCNLQREVSLETAYILKGKLGKHIHIYGGLGATGGLTLDNKMVLIEGRYLEPGEHPSSQTAEEVNKKSYGAKQTYYSRLYIPFGIKYGIGPKWQVGLDFRTGIGWQFLPGYGSNFIERSGAFIVGAKYCF